MAGVGFEWLSFSDVDQERAALASGFGHSQRQVLFRIGQRLMCAVFYPHDQQAFVVEGYPSRLRLWHPGG